MNPVIHQSQFTLLKTGFLLPGEIRPGTVETPAASSSILFLEGTVEENSEDISRIRCSHSIDSNFRPRHCNHPPRPLLLTFIAGSFDWAAYRACLVSLESRICQRDWGSYYFLFYMIGCYLWGVCCHYYPGYYFHLISHATTGPFSALMQIVAQTFQGVIKDMRIDRCRGKHTTLQPQ